MIKLTINNKTITVPKGTSLLKAAKQMGVEIPTMCFYGELEHFTSCMICLVKEENQGRLLPACSVKAEEGMVIITDDEEVQESRKVALELLLSEHVGDCEAPCVMACPAHMDIPTMNRLLAEDKMDEALKTVMKNIPLPSVLGHICPAPCEGACRRKTIDESVSICLLKRFAGDVGVFKPTMKNEIKGKVAIIGSGPAGLSAAYYLCIKGAECTIYDKELLPGGLMRTSIAEDLLPKEVLDREIEVIKKIGVRFKLGKEIDKELFEQLMTDNDAVIIASGVMSAEINWGVAHTNGAILADKRTYQTSLPGVFAIGNALRSSKLAIRSVGQGREVAISVAQMLSGSPVQGEKLLFNSRFGKLSEPEFSEFLKESIDHHRLTPASKLRGLSREDVITEAKRCLHCDCRAMDDCKLRTYSDQYKADQKRFKYNERKPVRKYFQHDVIVYEPEKCIKCGICVRITEAYKEEFGFTFVGRGFDVEIAVPFNQSMTKGLQKVALKVAEECPTGALSIKEKK